MAHVAHLPIIPLLHTISSSDMKEIAFKTIPSASKTEIKHVLQSFYNLEVQKVRTLNVKSKKKRHWVGSLVAKPDYKKVYVTLEKPLSFSKDLYPFHAMDDKKNKKMLASAR